MLDANEDYSDYGFTYLHSFTYKSYRFGVLGGGSGVVSCFVDEDRYLGELSYPEHIKNFNMVEAKIKSQIDKEGL
jgi:hypothetical protein